MWHPRVCVARRGRSDAEGCEKEAEARLVQRMHDGRNKRICVVYASAAY